MTSSEVNDGLDTAVCQVNLEFGQRSTPMLNRDHISKEMTGETVLNLKNCGVKVENGYCPAQLGATGGELSSIIDFILKFKQILGMVYVIGKTIYISHREYIHRKNHDRKPKVTVNLSIKSDLFASYDNFSDDLSSRLNILWGAAHSQAIWLSDKYPMYSFGVSVRCSISENGFHVSYNCPDCKNDFQSSRIFHALSFTKFHDGLSLFVSPAKFGAIAYTVTNPILIEDSNYYEHDWRFDGKQHKYYMYISHKIINGFVGSVRKMSFDKYKSDVLKY